MPTFPNNQLQKDKKSTLNTCICAIKCMQLHVKLSSGKHVHVAVHHIKPHIYIYIVKLGYTRVYLFFLFLLQNIFLLRFKQVPTIYVLSKNKKISFFFFNIIFFNFYNFRILYIGHVFVMTTLPSFFQSAYG